MGRWPAPPNLPCPTKVRARVFAGKAPPQREKPFAKKDDMLARLSEGSVDRDPNREEHAVSLGEVTWRASLPPRDARERSAKEAGGGPKRVEPMA